MAKQSDLIWNADGIPVDTRRGLPKRYEEAMLKIIRDTQKQMGAPLADFARLIGNSLPTGNVYNAKLLPRFSQMHIFTSWTNHSMVDVMREAGDDPNILPQAHLDFLKCSQALTDEEIAECNDLALNLSGRWPLADVLTYTNVAITRLFAAKEHISRANSFFFRESSEDVQKLRDRSGTQFLRLETRAGSANFAAWIVSDPERMLSGTESLRLDQIMILAREELDISPRWLSGISGQTNFFGFGAEIETLYDHWSLLNSPMRDVVTEHVKFLASRKEGGYVS